MRIVFAGTPEFAAQALSALASTNHDIVLVLTQPDRPAGRGMKPSGSAVKQFALARGLPLFQPNTLKDAAVVAALAEAQADVMVVAAYGLILPKAVLALPRYGCLNIHASLLPRWRGAAPIQRALLAGDRETGVTIMQMDEGLDTGAMLLRTPLQITDTDTAQTLHDKLATAGAEAIVQALDGLSQGNLTATPQDEAGATYAAKLTKAEAQLDWSKPAQELARAVWAYNPFPVAYTLLNGEMVKVWKVQVRNESDTEPGRVLKADREGVLVACGEGALLIEELQKAGGKRLSAAQYLAGNPLQAGNRFGA
jgi:methionyl-tRNA formyltransferase